MEFSSAIYRGDPCPEFSFSFKYIHMEVKCNTKFQNARVNSICLEFSLAYIFALLIATPIALYNVHAADCLPVQIGVTNEKTRRSETFNI